METQFALKTQLSVNQAVGLHRCTAATRLF